MLWLWDGKCMQHIDIGVSVKGAWHSFAKHCTHLASAWFCGCCEWLSAEEGTAKPSARQLNAASVPAWMHWGRGIALCALTELINSEHSPGIKVRVCALPTCPYASPSIFLSVDLGRALRKTTVLHGSAVGCKQFLSWALESSEVLCCTALILRACLT